MAPGNYTVTEAVPAGWSLTGLTCSNGSTVTLGTATANVAVAADEAVTCTFTNTRQGAIIIVKNTIGGDGAFDFTGAQSFSISTIGGTGNDTTTFASVVPGAYIVTETVPAGWSLTGLTCSNGSTVNGSTATANVVAGATVICTFTNLRNANVGIPTLADWGLMMLAILLMAAGWLRFRRQR